MTGYRSHYFRWNCRNKGCYYEQLPDWDDLIECFPRKIRPTDIDGMVEINGHFLFLEEKGPGCTPDDGQRIALRRLSQYPDVTTVLFRPSIRQPGDLECLVYGQGEPRGFQPRSRDSFKNWLRGWAAHADHTGRKAV
jgi:hypothetical protein